MQFQIIISGDELIEGRQKDANGQFLASALYLRGFEAGGVVFVGDDHDKLVRTFREAMAENDLVICSGGLGGTLDDLTRFALSEAVDSPLVENQDALCALRSFWQRIKRPFPKGTPLEAMMPAIAKMVPNGAGLAPGMYLRHEKSQFLCLPGVPTELRHMVEDGVLDLFGDSPLKMSQAKMRIVNMGESVIANRLGGILSRGRNPLCGIAAKHGEVILSLRAKAVTQVEADDLIGSVVAEIQTIFGEHVYSADGRNLAVVVTEELRRNHHTLAVAESLTGGLIGHELTELPGVSDVFLADFVTYSNEAKCQALSVDPKSIEENGAVSETVARQMAEGARLNVGADFGIATTGIAGPTGGSEEKPVGTCWVAASFADGTTWAEMKIHGVSRTEVKRRTVNHTFDLLRRLIDFVVQKNQAK
ncbi:MAG: nicotinamide-nucleotide amidase [Planctomycetota bacterium]|jgi:nicotinamide-nucleotide amidase